MSPMPSSILLGDTSTWALPSPLSRLDMPTSAIPTCVVRSNSQLHLNSTLAGSPVPAGTLEECPHPSYSKTLQLYYIQQCICLG